MWASRRFLMASSTFALVITLFLVIVDSKDLPTYVDHPCIRPCHADRPRVCRYHFHIEYYYTMTSACYDCPINVTDCYRPGCVPADGVRRGIFTVNRMLPGPAINVCKGDEIVIDVDNSIVSQSGVVLHWHGLKQRSSPYMDGAPMITQCLIPGQTSFQYRFQADDEGTHFWHSHAGFQRGDGVAGPLIIREPVTVDLHGNIYDEDLPEHVIFVQDWFLQLGDDLFTQLYIDNITPSVSILINGKGSLVNLDTDRVPTPTAVYHVTQGKRYRFRVINNGIRYCALKISVQDHRLIMITSDGNPFKPVEVDAFTISSGERFDFILHANQAVSNYIITAQGIAGCAIIVRQTAILNYEGATLKELGMSYSEVVGTEQEGKVLKSNVYPITEKGISLNELESLEEDEYKVMNEPDKRFYISLSKHPQSLPLSYFQLNNITSVVPSSPLLSQPEDISESMFCNGSSLGERNCSSEKCECIHRIKADTGDSVEIVLIGSPDEVHHPMHLHGYSFRILAQETFDEPKTMEEIKQMDAEGKLARNYKRPLIKDTITVPSQGYTIIRFVADNPGFWYFHCHLEFHAIIGMAMTLQVGDTEEHPRPPKNFPRCGNWKQEEDHTALGHDADSRFTNRPIGNNEKKSRNSRQCH